MPFSDLFGKKPIAARVGLPESVGRDLIEWLTLNDRDGRDYLATHLGLIRQETVAAIELMAEEMSASPKTAAIAGDVRKKGLIIQAIYGRGGTRDAVYYIYRDWMGV
jgi:hypothetical protein